MKKNVLQLVGSFHQGGSERQAIQLTQLLRSSSRFRIHLACLSPHGSLRRHAVEMGFNEIPSFPLTSFYDYNASRQLIRFATFLRSRSIDVVQSHDFYTNVFGMFGAATARVSARIAARRETSGVRTAAQSKAERLAYRLSHAIVANSDAVRKTLTDEGVSDKKIVTIYNGLDLSRFSLPSNFSLETTLSRFALPAGKRIVTIVANLRHPVKDHPTFLRAASRVLGTVSNAVFVLAGEGELMESIAKLSDELGLRGKTFFLGRCESINQLLAVSEVCVLSSTAEGFSNAILEYMGAGRPVVATDVGGAREAIREGVTGFLVPPGNPELMAVRIVELLGDPARATEMGKAGRRVVENEFSCETQLHQTEELYERLLATANIQHAGRSRDLSSESL